MSSEMFGSFRFGSKEGARALLKNAGILNDNCLLRLECTSVSGFLGAIEDLDVATKRSLERMASSCAISKQQFMKGGSASKEHSHVRIKALLPVIVFTITAANYFVMSCTYTLPILGQVVVKIAPVLSLLWFVTMHINHDGGRDSTGRKLQCGLFFSCIGDALLIEDDLFILGMLAFAMAQISYIAALGFDQLKISRGALVYGVNIIVTPNIIPSYNTVLRWCIPIYGFLLSTMGWRSISLSSSSPKGQAEWKRLLVGAGGVMWMISDSALAYNEFNQPIPYAKVIVMSTYYAGQLGIASAVLLKQ
ncbi:YhhN-like protein [Nesidiocoris tenuis]|uniref:lysoplasmalogenase n=1 Tax=Nesidiocoris tenuis TaxID=355587 RepID=A0ABN7ADI3_9HEMI|nr:YhhN-like protein [Nesidiocoris tenuis]